ncbi:MAG: efflux RND transporter periplasmic adaptor subunit [Veillonellaceae bacterium]|uniref:efflux RND transporter periplasmic adaptor subunit n=1 Tax=Selenomonas TaxID=970 RepID=UPI0025E8EE35|nr:efflux RND transporter periplasmic adaptor subunit [Selenomonas sp.]MCI6751954.1 efflux RND transporter periplasmic adaptor subunit [Selenomonas bovis]MCI7541105.1 efflux RND transporter periplasmic adaptor subunit [Veillonellaceae bacterium]MCI6232376.1 efflux RND transporter periplasmic adaptor subunit [Selenomonas sp.]MDD6127668.1 efflux RND transporter periplasmic adaptor subunit [Veillonellaceae bacterium]MDD6697487.1 efflux RND transporter periplasmic adaptor subunit [Veillonellaceae 
MHFAKRKKPIALMLALALAASALLAGCGGQKQQAAGGAAQVKAMKVLQQDTPVVSEYAGQIAGKDEVKVQSKVSGRVVEKYFHGGDFVQAGQPLYRIDSRQYESAVLQAQATLAQSQATLANAQTDLGRDQELLASDAISEQQVTTQQANVNAYSAAAAANQALLQKAQQDLSDTVVYAPMSGQVSVDDVAIGTFATAGNTNLVTIGTTDPVFVTFSISETEYLKFRNIQQMQSGSGNGITVAIKLSDGTTYPLDGRIVQADRALTQNSGTLTVKALFGNPDGLLLPGMFARVKLTGETVPNAILVPQRAVQQLLDKTFVMVVGADGKSEARKIELGQQVGSYYIVKSGLSAEDTVIVEGLSSLTEGKDLTVTMVTPADMGFSLDEDTTPYDTMTSSDASSGSES